MKNNNLAKFTAFVILITIVALILVSGTYAKYTTTVSGTGTATVAKFSVGATANSKVITDSTSFELFETVNEADGTTTESDVATGKIAPGTGGSFEIKLTNDSEVSVGYTLALEETNDSSIPIEYKVGESAWTTATNFTKEGTLEIGSTTQTAETVTVQWRWAYEGTSSTNYTGTQTDTTDTELGTMGTLPTVQVKVSAVFTQVD